METITVHIPKEKLHELDGANHHKKNEWVKMIYYEKKKETMLYPDQVINEYKKCDFYKKNCFYKIVQLSNKDDKWDYYRKLKPEFNESKYIGAIKKDGRMKKKKATGVKFIHLDKPIKLDFS